MKSFSAAVVQLTPGDYFSRGVLANAPDIRHLQSATSDRCAHRGRLALAEEDSSVLMTLKTV